MRPARLSPALLLALPLVAAAQPADGPAAERAQAEARFVRALAAHAAGVDSTAARLLDGLLADHPGDAALLETRAGVALAADRAADAVYFAERAASAAPDRPDVRLRHAQALRAAGSLSAAAEALAEARRLAPDSPAVLRALADVAREAGRADAEREALEALAAAHDAADVRLRLSSLYEQAGDAARAQSAAEAAARLAPADPAVQRRLAALAPPAGSAPPASASATPAEAAPSNADALLATVEADPRRLDVWALALAALAQAGDPRAGATADDALLLFPTVPSVLAPAAEAYLAAGRPADARRAAQSGLDALDALGSAVADADALRVRLDRVLGAAGN